MKKDFDTQYIYTAAIHFESHSMFYWTRLLRLFHLDTTVLQLLLWKAHVLASSNKVSLHSIYFSRPSHA